MRGRAKRHPLKELPWHRTEPHSRFPSATHSGRAPRGACAARAWCRASSTGRAAKRVPSRSPPASFAPCSLRARRCSTSSSTDSKAVPVVIKEQQHHPVRGDVTASGLPRGAPRRGDRGGGGDRARGRRQAPGVREGGVLEHVTREVTVEALPTDDPRADHRRRLRDGDQRHDQPRLRRGALRREVHGRRAGGDHHRHPQPAAGRGGARARGRGGGRARRRGRGGSGGRGGRRGRGREGEEGEGGREGERRRSGLELRRRRSSRPVSRDPPLRSAVVRRRLRRSEPAAQVGDSRSARAMGAAATEAEAEAAISRWSLRRRRGSMNPARAGPMP